MTIPQGKITFSNHKTINNNQYLLVAGGRAPSSDFLKCLAQDRKVVCADRGISYCKAAQVIPQALLGDGDSCYDDWSWAEKQNIYTEKYSCDKDVTDLQIALNYIFSFNNCDTLFVTGIWGGRFDHLHSAVSVLSKYVLDYNCKVILLDEQECMILFADQSLDMYFDVQPQVISVLPFSDQINISLSGCKWDMSKVMIKKDNLYTISNCLQNGNKAVKVILHEGLAGFYSFYG